MTRITPSSSSTSSSTTSSSVPLSKPNSNSLKRKRLINNQDFSIDEGEMTNEVNPNPPN